MRLAVFGDLHGEDPKEIMEYINSERVDVTLVNGDLIKCNGNKRSKLNLEQIVESSNSLIVAIPGNYEDKNEWGTKLTQLTKEYDNIVDNNRRKFKFGDYSIVSYGGGTVAPPCSKSIYWNNPTIDVSELAILIDDKTILQLHEPPKYYGDSACAYINKNVILPLPCNHPAAKKVNAGNEWLTYLIEGELGSPTPRLVVAGHIHESIDFREIGTRKETYEANHLFVNPGAAKDGHYAIIEIDDDLTRVIKHF